jgi:hypothetical protein
MNKFLRLVYGGIRWGRDFSQSSPPIPLDKNGKPLFDEKDESQLDKYDEWLVDHLLTIPIEPNEEQKGLCNWVDKMILVDSMIFLGMNAALYQLDIEWIEEYYLYPGCFVEDCIDDEPVDLKKIVKKEVKSKK